MAPYLSQCIHDLNNLGIWLQAYLENKDSSGPLDSAYSEFHELIQRQHACNNWHTTADIRDMLNHLSGWLQEGYLENQVLGISSAPVANENLHLITNPGFAFSGIQEWVACLLTRTPFYLDPNPVHFQVIKYLHHRLTNSFPEYYGSLWLQHKIKTEKYILYQNKDTEASIRYFANKKALIIRNRPSAGIITGKETYSELQGFGKDYFTYLGQSPAALRKLFIPRHYDLNKFLDAMMPFAGVYNNNKYANNYDYQQSLLLMDRIPFLDTGFLVFRENKTNEAPTGCLYYEYYDDPEALKQQLLVSGIFEKIISCEKITELTISPGTLHYRPFGEYYNQKKLLDFLTDTSIL